MTHAIKGTDIKKVLKDNGYDTSKISVRVGYPETIVTIKVLSINADDVQELLEDVYTEEKYPSLWTTAMTYDTPHDDREPYCTIKANYCWELDEEAISEGKELANKLHIKALENSIEKKIGCFSTENYFVTFDDGFMVIKCKYNQSNKLAFGDVEYGIPRILVFIKYQEPEVYGELSAAV